MFPKLRANIRRWPRRSKASHSSGLSRNFMSWVSLRKWVLDPVEFLSLSQNLGPQKISSSKIFPAWPRSNAENRVAAVCSKPILPAAAMNLWTDVDSMHNAHAQGSCGWFSICQGPNVQSGRSSLGTYKLPSTSSMRKAFSTPLEDSCHGKLKVNVAAPKTSSLSCTWIHKCHPVQPPCPGVPQ